MVGIDRDSRIYAIEGITNNNPNMPAVALDSKYVCEVVDRYNTEQFTQ